MKNLGIRPYFLRDCPKRSIHNGTDHRFSAESDQMLESALQISGAIENISAITEQSAAGTQEVSAAMNEQIHVLKGVAEETEK